MTNSRENQTVLDPHKMGWIPRKRIYSPYMASVKNTIIETLAMRGTASLRYLRKNIHNRCGNRTSQAVCKALKELVQSEQVIRVEWSCYALNPAFLQELGEFCHKALANCPLNTKEVI